MEAGTFRQALPPDRESASARLALAARHALNIYAAWRSPTCCCRSRSSSLFSFNDPPGRYNFAWVGFTTEYWQPPVRDHAS